MLSCIMHEFCTIITITCIRHSQQILFMSLNLFAWENSYYNVRVRIWLDLMWKFVMAILRYNAKSLWGLRSLPFLFVYFFPFEIQPVWGKIDLNYWANHFLGGIQQRYFKSPNCHKHNNCFLLVGVGTRSRIWLVFLSTSRCERTKYIYMNELIFVNKNNFLDCMIQGHEFQAAIHHLWTSTETLIDWQATTEMIAPSIFWYVLT